MEHLKRCPFCGGKAVLKDYEKGKGGLWMIHCDNHCGVLMTGEGKNGNIGREKEIHAEIKECVIKNWNKRYKF